MIARRWAPSLLWTVIIFTFTSIPDPGTAGFRIAGLDKAIHASLYAVLAVLSARALSPARQDGRLPRARALLGLLLGILALGAVDEWHQQFIAGRSMELLDWLADGVGAAGGLLAFVLNRRRSVEYSR
ncbi:MAG TPA: VanZ family protein [Gemmatimonadaceae bacterium]|nr:VanZ family protein [Gemmatimonadaceae bacterium]